MKLPHELPNNLRLDRDLRKLGNFKAIHGMIGIDRKVVNLPPKMKILTALLQNCKKSAIEHSIEKPTLLCFVYLSTIFCPKLSFLL